MELNDLKNAIRELYRKDVYDDLTDYMKYMRTDEQAADHGPLTRQIAEYFEMPLNKARYHLNKYRKAGHLVKDGRNYGSNRWVFTGFLEEIKKSA